MPCLPARPWNFGEVFLLKDNYACFQRTVDRMWLINNSCEHQSNLFHLSGAVNFFDNQKYEKCLLLFSFNSFAYRQFSANLLA